MTAAERAVYVYLTVFFFECTKVIGERWRKMTAADRAEYEPTPQQIQVCFIQKKKSKKNPHV